VSIWRHASDTAHAVWLNTQNCAWFVSKIYVICCELSRASPPNTIHHCLCPWAPQRDFSPQTPSAVKKAISDALEGRADVTVTVNALTVCVGNSENDHMSTFDIIMRHACTVVTHCNVYGLTLQSNCARIYRYDRYARGLLQ